MSIYKHTAITALLQGWQNNNAQLMRQHVTPDFRLFRVFAVEIGIDGLIMMARAYQTAFPDWQVEYTAVQNTDEQFDVLLHMSGTHLGPYPNLIASRPAIAPTGRRFDVSDIPISIVLHDEKVWHVEGSDVTQQKVNELFAQLLAPVHAAPTPQMPRAFAKSEEGVGKQQNQM